MLHAALAAYIICFAGGVTLVVMSLLTSRRLSQAGFRDFAVLFSAATLLMLVDALKTYERLLSADFGAGLHVAAIVLSVLGNVGLAWYFPSLALQVVRINPAPFRTGLHGFLAAALGALAGLKEAAGLPGAPPGPSNLLRNLDFLALLGVTVYAAGILFSGVKRIESPMLRSFSRGVLTLVGVFIVVAAAQSVFQNLPCSPVSARDYPLAQMGLYIGFVILALVNLARYYSYPAQSTGLKLPDGFVRRFGISRREKDIIEMMSEGFSNNAIAEKLYISTLTVKNHVYHIYQKTGAGNKVQLLNMINSSK